MAEKHLFCSSASGAWITWAPSLWVNSACGRQSPGQAPWRSAGALLWDRESLRRPQSCTSKGDRHRTPTALAELGACPASLIQLRQPLRVSGPKVLWSPGFVLEMARKPAEADVRSGLGVPAGRIQGTEDQGLGAAGVVGSQREKKRTI